MANASSILTAIKQSTVFFEGYNLNPTICACEKCKVSRYRHTHEPGLADPAHSYWQYLKYCIGQVQIEGMWLEFGVGSGMTLSFIADHKPGETIYGFDSFEGLPEDWKISDDITYPKFKYSRNGEAPALPQDNIQFIKGYYDVSLLHFLQIHLNPCAFIHIDCDLYSSAITVLKLLFEAGRIVRGTVILFDEFYNYQNFEEHEYKSFIEFISLSKIDYCWLAHTSSPFTWNGNQVALIVL